MSRQVRFEGEESQEQSILILRPHIITNLGWIIVIAALLLVPLLIKPFFDFTHLDVSLDKTTAILLLLSWDLLLLAIAFQKFLYWYFNIYIVTNKRIVDMDFFGLFYRKVSEALLANVEDVSISKGGILQNFFDFGNLMFQTAGARENFLFESVPDPESVQKRILELATICKRQNEPLT
jgi:hypothetical protein